MSRETLLLSTGWRFQPDPDDYGERAGYPRAEADTHRWRLVTVPCSFEQAHPDLERYDGIGWYACDLHIPATWAGRRIALRFEGVNYHARVWFNGALVGEHPDGFLPFEFDITEYVRIGCENRLMVRADNLPLAGEVPGANVGWRPYGGILRQVYLLATSPCFLEGVRVVAEPDGSGAEDGPGRVQVRLEVRNASTASARVRPEVVLSDGTGQTILRLVADAVEVPAGQSKVLELAGQVPRVGYWSPNSPTLYTLTAWLDVGGGETDALKVRVGFRRIAARAGTLWLNGQPIYLKGFNRHEDSPTADMCSDLDTVRRDLLEIKALGGNWVRLCHYPHHPGELELCDELGLLAMGEIPVYGSTGMAEGEVQWAAKMAAARRQLTALIARDVNHPSVIMWSVSNETHEQHARVAAGNDALIRHARALDPTRLVVHVSDHCSPRLEGRGRTLHFAEDDVICLNEYPWWSHARVQLPEGMAEATPYWRELLAELHAAYPEKPILVAEFGYWSYDGVYGLPRSVDWHARLLEHQYAGMDAPYVCGATIWCFADHPWPCGDRSSLKGYSPFGVYTRARTPKAEVVETVRRLFAIKRPSLSEPGS